MLYGEEPRKTSWYSRIFCTASVENVRLMYLCMFSKTCSCRPCFAVFRSMKSKKLSWLRYMNWSMAISYCSAELSR